MLFKVNQKQIVPIIKGVGRRVSSFLDYLFYHEGLEDFRDEDAAISLLVIFHDGDKHPGQGQS